MTREKGTPVSEGDRRNRDARSERGRFSAKRKVAAALRLLRSEDLDRVSRDLKVTAATLSAWREDFLAGGQSNLKSRLPGPQDEEILRLKAMVGDLTMRNELLREQARAHRANLPVASRRSRR